MDAFLAASRDGDFEALLAVLDPGVVFRVDVGRGLVAQKPGGGARAVASRILARGTPLAPFARVALVDGRVGAVVAVDGVTTSVVRFTSVAGAITAIDVTVDPVALRRLSLG